MQRRHNENPMDEFIDQDVFKKSSQGGYSIPTLVTIFLISIGVIIGLCYSYNIYKNKTHDEIIIISADTDETKAQPSDPGGMVVNNMDKDVYDTIDKSHKKNHEEIAVLLPPTEEPIDKQEFISNEKIIADKKDIADKNEEYIKPVVQKTSKNKTKFAKKTEKFYKVQIASFKSANDAKKEWVTLSKKFPKMLGKYQHYIVSKNIEGKGIFQRLQVGPFDNERTARKTCSEFKEAGLNCFVIKP